MRAKLANITVMIQKAPEEDWPDAVARAELIEAIER